MPDSNLNHNLEYWEDLKLPKGPAAEPLHIALKVYEEFALFVNHTRSDSAYLLFGTYNLRVNRQNRFCFVRLLYNKVINSTIYIYIYSRYIYIGFNNPFN